MNINSITEQNYGIDQVNTKKDRSTVKANDLNSVFSTDNNTSSMNKTEFNKSSLLSGLCCDGNIDSLKEQAKMLKDNLTAVFNKMETGQGQSFDEDGISVNDTEVHKIVTVVDQIRIKLAMFCDDYRGSADVDLEGIEDIVGSAALAYKISSKLKSNSIPATEDNVSEVMQAVNMASSIKPLDSNSKAYMVKNKLELTIDNIYKAEYAGAYAEVPSTISDKQWNELQPQVEEVIKNCGYEVNQGTLNNAKWMLENSIDLTEENFTALQELSDIEEPKDLNKLLDRIAATIIEGDPATDTLLTDKKLPWEETVKAIWTLNNATKSDIMLWTQSDKQLDIDNLYSIVTTESNTEVNENDINYIRNYRQVQEARLMMTIDAGRTLEKAGVSINTTELSDLVEQLKQYEQNQMDSISNKESDPVTRMQVEQSNQVLMALESLRSVPSAVIGSVIQADETRTINTFIFHAPSILSKLVQAGEAYETMSTEVRPDLGDSVIKAVSASTDDLLSGMGYENNEANARAVRILAYNSMDINEKNVDAVKNIDYSVNKLFKEMTPAAALEMIRNNVNPLETDVTTLNNYLSEINDGNKTEVEKYSEYLYRLDKKNDITEEEREKFIGVYKLVTSFNKDGGKAIGQLVNQGLDLTMGNLLTAYMSRNDSGIDVTVDEDFGLAEISNKVSYFKSLFSDMNKKIKPDNITSAVADLDNMTPEQLAKIIDESKVPEDDVVYEKYTQMQQEVKDVEDSIIRMITDNEIPATYSNIIAAQELAGDPSGFFRKYYSMQDSNSTEDTIINTIDDKTTVNEEYDKILDNTRKIIDDAVQSSDSYLDIESLRLMGNSISLISSMAKRNNYYIPFEKDGEIGTINLKIIENSEESGLFTVDMKGSNHGDIHVEAKVSNNTINAQILCNTTDEVTDINSRISNIKENLINSGFEEVNITVNKADEFPYDVSKSMDGTSVKALFSASKIFISELIK